MDYGRLSRIVDTEGIDNGDEVAVPAEGADKPFGKYEDLLFDIGDGVSALIRKIGDYEPVDEKESAELNEIEDMLLDIWNRTQGSMY